MLQMVQSGRFQNPKNPLHLQKINIRMDAEITDADIVKIIQTFENRKENQEDK